MSRFSEILRQRHEREQQAGIEGQARLRSYEFVRGTGSEVRLFDATADEREEMLCAGKTGSDLVLISNEIKFARHSHSGQLRRDNITPHVNHSERTAIRLGAAGANLEMQIDALLHDTGEDWDEDMPPGRLQRLGRRGTVEEFDEEFARYHPYSNQAAMRLNKIKIMDRRGKDPKVYYETILQAGLMPVKVHDRIDSALGDLSRLTRAFATANSEELEKHRQQARRSREKTKEMRPYLPLPKNDPLQLRNKVEVTIRTSEILTETPINKLMALAEHTDAILSNSHGRG